MRRKERRGPVIILLAVTLLSAVLAAPSAAGDGATAERVTVRIMPLGDSITQADEGHASYRRPLWRLLVDAAHPVEFVGSLRANHGGLNPHSDFDLDHEGHWGWRTDQILAQVKFWALSAQPDVVLVHLGTNDLLQSQTPASTAAEIRSVVSELRGARPGVTVILSTLIPQTWTSPAPFDDLNRRIIAMAAELDTPEARVVLSQPTTVDATTDLYDGVHPNDRGERKLAQHWFDALVRVLADPSSSTTTSTAAKTIAPPVASLIVRARGDVGEEQLIVTVGGVGVGVRTVTTAMAEYEFSVPSNTSIGQVRLAYRNDFYAPPIDRNLEVDWLRLDGATYEAEGAAVITSGAWTGSGCSEVGTFRADKLVCNGYFDFGNVSDPGSTTNSVPITSTSTSTTTPTVAGPDPSEEHPVMVEG